MSNLTRAERLAADRDLLEEAMDEAGPGQLAALVREHRAVLAEIEKLSATPRGSILDQLSQKRREREAAAEGPVSSEA